MVTLELKQVRVADGRLLDYKSQLMVIVRNTAPLDPQGNQQPGFSDSDMAEAEALADKLEAANGSIELSAAEVMHLAGKVRNFKWPFSDKGFRQLVAEVTALTTQ